MDQHFTINIVELRVYVILRRESKNSESISSVLASMHVICAYVSPRLRRHIPPPAK